jgi:hypothetical protein
LENWETPRRDRHRRRVLLALLMSGTFNAEQTANNP